MEEEDDEYELPDGHVVKLGKERIQCPEVLFQPHMFGLEANGVHQLTHDTIQKCDIDLRRGKLDHLILLTASKISMETWYCLEEQPCSKVLVIVFTRS